jgi:PadR family transcriptional regulator PadR
VTAPYVRGAGIVDFDVANVYVDFVTWGGRVGRDFPGEFEQMVLLAILRLGDGAYALAIVRELDRQVEREVSRGALYKTLERLESKGHVVWSTEAATPDRGGHPRRLFTVTPGGVEVLRSSRDALLKLWDGLDPILGERPA